MDSTVSPRLVTSVLALLFCLVASLRVGEMKVKPARMVTEVVAITMVNPRVAKAALAGDPAAGVMHLAASGADKDPIAPVPVTPSEGRQATKEPAALATDRPAAPRPPAGKPAAKAPAQVAPAATAAKSRAGGSGRSKPAQHAPVLVKAAPASPAVPPLFVPLRRLGLSIQAKLPGQPARTAPALKPAEPCGPMAV